MKEVEFDGEIHEFPDHFDDAKIAAALRQIKGAKANRQVAEKVIQPQPTIVDRAKDFTGISTGEFSPTTTALGGLLGPLGSFGGSIAGQMAETANRGQVMDPAAMTRNAAIDAILDWAGGKVFKGAGNAIGRFVDLKKADTGTGDALKDAFLKMRVPEKPEPILPGTVVAQDAPDLPTLRKQFTYSEAPQTLLELTKNIRPDTKGSRLAALEGIFKNRETAAQFKATASPEALQETRKAYFERLVGSSESVESSTFKPAKMIQDLEDINGPAAEFFDARQRARLIRFAKKAEAKMGQDLAVNKAAAIAEGTGNLVFNVMDAGMWGRSIPAAFKRTVRGAAVRVTMGAAERVLTTPKLTENVTRMMDIKPDSPEAKFASKFIFGALKGAQIQLKFPNSDAWFNGSVDENGKIQLDSSK